METCVGKAPWAEVRWGFLEERKFSKSRTSVQCQGSWEILKAWVQERDWKLEIQVLCLGDSISAGSRAVSKCTQAFGEANTSGDDGHEKDRGLLRGPERHGHSAPCGATRGGTRVSRGQREQEQTEGTNLCSNFHRKE